MKDSQKKRITRNYHLLRRVESWKCCRVTAFICPNCSGIQTNTWNISLKKTVFLSPEIVKWNSFMFFLLMMMNSASASLQVLWMWAACISLHTFQRTLRVSACRGQRLFRYLPIFLTVARYLILRGNVRRPRIDRYNERKRYPTNFIIDYLSEIV